MNIPYGFLPAREIKKYIDVNSNTLRTWADNGKIKFIKSDLPGAHRFYNLREFIESSGIVLDNKIPVETRKQICYCRVSTPNQKSDLNRQIEYLKSRFPNHEIISDIGSGINFKRPGIKTILDYAIKGNLEEVVVAYKDRLTRFGFEMFQWIIQTYSKGKITILNNVSHSPEQELSEDVLAILNVFSARINGLRKYHSKIKEEFQS